MRITIDGRRVELDKSTLLAQGGEGEIHIDPDNPRSQVVKIYHDPTPPRAAKLEAIIRSGVKYSGEVMAPQALALGSRSEIVGFQMRQLSRRYKRGKELFSADFCTASGITTHDVVQIMLSAGLSLRDAIHANGVTVGDLNDGSYLFHEQDKRVAWVDVDSWDIPGFPCIVGTELYLCPALYGIDLSRGQLFKPWHDWFSYTVLLFRSLLRKHPFKAGIHPVFRSVMDRTRNGLTVLDPEVTYPDNGVKPEVLSDELIHALLAQLKGSTRGAFDLELLRKFGETLIACPSCGTSYHASRKSCPNCSAKTVVDIGRFVELLLTELLQISGRVLAVKILGRELRVLTEEGGILVHYGGTATQLKRTELGLGSLPTMRFALQDRTILLTNDTDLDTDVADLYLLEVGASGIRPVRQTSTTILRGQGSAFAASERFIYRIAQNTLLAGERFGANDLLERPVLQVFQNQSWFTCDPNPADGVEVICGYNRDRARMIWFVASCPRGSTTFTSREVAIPEIRRSESVNDISVRIADGQIMIARRTRYRGKEFVYLDLLEAKTTTSLASTLLDITDAPQWDSVDGKGFASGVVMHATDGGIVREDLRSRTVTVLKDSQTLVSGDDSLLPFDGGILRVGARALGLIRKK